MRCKIYTKEGDEFLADSVRPVKNSVGTGYRVESGGRIFFYKTEEIVDIMPLNE